MLPLDLVSSWPGLAKISAEEVLASPAYRIPCVWQEEKAALVFGGKRPVLALGVCLQMAQEEQVLGIAQGAKLPTLASLGEQWEELPRDLALAAIEQDLGELFGVLEEVTQHQLSVKGLVAVDDPRFVTARNLSIVQGNGEDVLDFLLSLSPAMVKNMGNLKYLQLNHPELSNMALKARVEVAEFAVEPSDLAGMKAGDAFELSEMSGSGPWKVLVLVGNTYSVLGTCTSKSLVLSSSPIQVKNSDNLVHIMVQGTFMVSLENMLALVNKGGTAEISFGIGATLDVEVGGKVLASGRLEHVGDTTLLLLQHVEAPAL